jgi:hypothetical protein
VRSSSISTTLQNFDIFAVLAIFGDQKRVAAFVGALFFFLSLHGLRQHTRGSPSEQQQTTTAECEPYQASH